MMKKLLKRIWIAINSPVADIIGGIIFSLASVLFFCFFCDDTWSVFVAFASGFLSAVGIDCLGHGLDRFNSRKSSASADDNKNPTK